MHWDSFVLPVGFVVPLVGAPFDHCLGSIHSLVFVEYFFSITCLLCSYPTDKPDMKHKAHQQEIKGVIVR